jgi:hypothetical protein
VITPNVAVRARAQPDWSHLAQVFIASLALLWLGYCVMTLGLPGFGGPGGDFGVYMSIGHRVLDGGPLYTAAQLAGPHETLVGDAMYPPSTMPLILAFASLPEPIARTLWYGVPIAIYAWVMWRIRPTGWRAVIALVLIALPSSVEVIWLGNPALWAAAAVALGTLYRWPAVFVLVKPSLLPFALLGLRDRRGWLVLAGFAVVTLLTLPLTLAWINVILNARGPYSGLLYSLGNVPLMLAPLVAIGHRKLGGVEMRR